MKRILLASMLVAAACGPKRTTAASQPTPAAFDATKSDPKALALVDAATTALGGYDKWNAVKELRFDLKYNHDGHVLGWDRHMWDRWNGRHKFMVAQGASLDDPSKVQWLEIRYDVFDDGKLPYGTFNGQSLDEAGVAKYLGVAKDKLRDDAYYVLFPFKLRDPGVHVSDEGPMQAYAGTEEACKPGCESVKVTFDPEVGKDTWIVDYNTETHLPVVLEKVVGEGRVGFLVEGWVEAGGLKFPAKLSNIGVKGDFIEYSGVSIGEPSDDAYDAPIDRSQGTSTKTNEPEQKPAKPLGPESTPGTAPCTPEPGKSAASSGCRPPG